VALFLSLRVLDQGAAPWVKRAMNPVCHREERSDVAIHWNISWIATPAEPGAQ
jgi:hypothetical protein